MKSNLEARFNDPCPYISNCVSKPDEDELKNICLADYKKCLVYKLTKEEGENNSK